jgi:hypothetical protein
LVTPKGVCRTELGQHSVTKIISLAVAPEAPTKQEFFSTNRPLLPFSPTQDERSRCYNFVPFSFVRNNSVEKVVIPLKQ